MPVDVEILKLLDEHALELQPSNIARNIDYDGNYVRQRCNTMHADGLLTKDAVGSNPFYAITTEGRKVLSNKNDNNSSG